MMRPLDAQKAEIDGLIVELDRDRARIADHAARTKAAVAPKRDSVPSVSTTTPPPPPTPAQWAADPIGRHQHRYWDGSRWTEHVSDGGVASIDPMPR